MRKELTQQATLNAALLLMEASPKGQTTTLETKTLLRFLSFEAVQSDVSEHLDTLETLCGVHVAHGDEDGTTFRIFSLSPIVVDEPEVVDASVFQFRK